MAQLAIALFIACVSAVPLTLCADETFQSPHMARITGREEYTRKDPKLARRLRLITMSSDPVHYTPKRMADYAAPALQP